MTPYEALQKLDLAGLRRPETVTLAITGTCNLACHHCWVEAGVPSAAGHVPELQLKQIITECAALGGRGIRLTGGEPLCHPAWLEIMKFSRTIGFPTLALQTNGILFTDEHVSALRELNFPGLSIELSLDGATAETHDLVRGRGVFTKTVDAIHRLVRGGLAGRISLFMTEMRHNLEEIPALLEYADSMGIGSVSSGALVLCGRASADSVLQPPEHEQYLRLLDRYDTDGRFRELYQKIGTIAALEWRNNGADRTECCTFAANPYITPVGRMYPCLMCHSDEFSVTGVYEKGLAVALSDGVQLWSTLQRISRNRSETIEECRDCPGKQRCAGGCMGRAWGSSKNYRTLDDRCNLRRTIYSMDCSTSSLPHA
jgi:radical SAM protein with 4Fe4S-binding SPASM domain